jgi:hypothetical protein
VSVLVENEVLATVGEDQSIDLNLTGYQQHGKRFSVKFWCAALNVWVFIVDVMPEPSERFPGVLYIKPEQLHLLSQLKPKKGT